MEEAVELLEQVVKIRGTTLAVDHTDQLASQHAPGHISLSDLLEMLPTAADAPFNAYR